MCFQVIAETELIEILGEDDGADDFEGFDEDDIQLSEKKHWQAIERRDDSLRSMGATTDEILGNLFSICHS